MSRIGKLAALARRLAGKAVERACLAGVVRPVDVDLPVLDVGGDPLRQRDLHLALGALEGHRAGAPPRPSPWGPA